MKKIKHILFVLLAFIMIYEQKAHAQIFYAGPNVSGGLSVVRHHKQEYRDQFNSKIKPTFKGGLSLHIPLTTTFILSGDLNYAMRGRKIEVQENEWVLNEWHHYAELPLLLMIEKEGEIRQIGPFDRIGPFNWTFGVGPNISYLLGGSGTLETFSLHSDYRLSFGGKESDYHFITFDPVNRFQWGLDFQIGLTSPLINGSRLITNIKYTYGHTNLGIIESSTMPILGFTDNIAHNYQMLSLSVAYLFKFDLSLLKKGGRVKGQKIKTKAIDTGPNKGKNINKIKKRKK